MSLSDWWRGHKIARAQRRKLKERKAIQLNCLKLHVLNTTYSCGWREICKS